MMKWAWSLLMMSLLSWTRYLQSLFLTSECIYSRLKVLHLSRGFLHHRNSYQDYVPSNRFATWTWILQLPGWWSNRPAATRRMKQATDLQLEHVSCYYAHLWCLILLVLLPLLCSRCQLFCFNSMRLSMVWYAAVALFSDWSKSPRKSKSFHQAKEKTMQMTTSPWGKEVWN
jgi:hypothetical protein